MVRIIPNIPKKFNGQFPSDYQNTFPNWGFFSKEEIESNKGKLLMMDIDFGRYCSLSCPTCFRKSNVVDEGFRGDLTYDELLKVIDDAKKVGLQSIKICGAGEPTQNTRFFQFIRDLTDREINVAIFTKGQVLGDDEETKRFNRIYGITSAQRLCRELAKYDNVSVMLSFQSFDTEKQDQIVGRKGHTLIRNRALENLVNAGFNESNPSRLALINAPITQLTYDEAFDIYISMQEKGIYTLY